MRQIPTSSWVKISKKKPIFPIAALLAEYLEHVGRTAPFTLQYEDLLGYQEGFPLQDKNGEDSLWDWVIYPQQEWERLTQQLTSIYAWLKTPDTPEYTDHLNISRVEFCNFGNSKPFRIRVVNRHNDNHDYYYVKRADASRVYGLELEHVLAPNRIDFLVQGETMVEEHITGIPGDAYLQKRKLRAEQTHVRIAKEFVKFSERCFSKLLGDMRSYNYVVVVTQDFDMEQIRVRAIDFDQQSYEGQIEVYLPHFYEENRTMLELVWDVLKPETIRQYQKEERGLMARRLKAGWSRVDDLLFCMEQDTISTEDRVEQLRNGLARYHRDRIFLEARTMGQLTRQHLTSMVFKGG
ncbi:MAG: hypothetical protein EA427_09500 [Spirochaetaceae bacterium]|nr:MAG: hypothetical protein EA427_09500 [Spirochaetaceae bacterium]